MSARRDALRFELMASRDETLALIDGLTPGHLSGPTHNGYADVHDTLAHLASAEGGRILLTRACLLLYPMSIPGIIINWVNAFNVGVKKRKTIEGLKRDLQAGREHVWRWLDRLHDADLDRRLNDPIHGRQALSDVIRLGFAGHERGHLDEIRRALSIR